MARDPYTFANQANVPQPIVQQIQTLLKSWDQAPTDYEYLNVFKPDGVLHVLAEPAVGHEAMKQLHDSMIDAEKGPVVNIQHYFNSVYVLAGENASPKTEVIYTGTLSNQLLGGQCIVTDYATKVVFSKGEADTGPFLIEYLRVFSDTSELMAAIRAIMENRPAN